MAEYFSPPLSNSLSAPRKRHEDIWHGSGESAGKGGWKMETGSGRERAGEKGGESKVSAL